METRGRKAKRLSNEQALINHEQENLNEVNNSLSINSRIPPECISNLLQYFNDKEKVINMATCKQWFQCTELKNLPFIFGYKNFYNMLFQSGNKLDQIRTAEVDTSENNIISKAGNEYKECKYFIFKILTEERTRDITTLSIKLNNNILFPLILSIKIEQNLKVKLQIMKEPVMEISFVESNRIIRLKFSDPRFFHEFQEAFDKKNTLPQYIDSVEFKSTSYLDCGQWLPERMLDKVRNLKNLYINFVGTPKGERYADFICMSRKLIRNNNQIQTINILYNQHQIEKMNLTFAPNLLINFIKWVNDSATVYVFVLICGLDTKDFPILRILKNVRHLTIKAPNYVIVTQALYYLCVNKDLSFLRSLSIRCPESAEKTASFENRLECFCKLHRSVETKINKPF